LVKLYQRRYGDPTEKLGSPVRAYQGHSRSSELTWIDRAHMTSVATTYRFQDIGRKFRIYLNLLLFNAFADGVPLGIV